MKTSLLLPVQLAFIAIMATPSLFAAVVSASAPPFVSECAVAFSRPPLTNNEVSAVFEKLIERKRDRRAWPLFNGILFRTENGQLILGLSELIGGRHRNIVINHDEHHAHDKLARIFWAGELEFSSDGHRLLRANETAGMYSNYMSARSAKVPHRILGWRDFSNSVLALRDALAQTAELPFSSSDTKYLPFSTTEKYLHPKMEDIPVEGNPEGRKENYTHELNNAVGSLVMVAGLYGLFSPADFWIEFKKHFSNRALLKKQIPLLKVFFDLRRDNLNLRKDDPEFFLELLSVYAEDRGLPLFDDLARFQRVFNSLGYVMQEMSAADTIETDYLYFRIE